VQHRFLITVFAALLLSACGEDDQQLAAQAPAPKALTRDAIGYYCNMIVADHLGPKGQVLISGRDQPLWFASARDTIVFTLLPEEPKSIAAIYVNDMGRASWDHPETDTWIDARKAWYVIGSNRVGGMGAPETVPFAVKADAESFANQYGGQTVAFADVPRDYVLDDGSQFVHGNMQHGTGDSHDMNKPSVGMAASAGNDMSTLNSHGPGVERDMK
jgi:copper chaperone NosL